MAIIAMAAVAAGSALAKGISSSNANSRAGAASVQGQQIINGLQAQGAGNVNKAVQQISQSNPAAYTGSSTNAFLQNLRANNAGAIPGAAAVPGANAAYAQGLLKARQGLTAYSNTQAGDLGAIRGAINQRANEGAIQQNLNSNNGALGALAGSQGFVNSLRTAAAGQQDPWTATIANMASGAANAGAMNYGRTGNVLGYTSGIPTGSNP